MDATKKQPSKIIDVNVIDKSYSILFMVENPLFRRKANFDW